MPMVLRSGMEHLSFQLVAVILTPFFIISVSVTVYIFVKAQQPVDNRNKLKYLTIAVIDRMKMYNDSPQKNIDNSRTMFSNQITF